MIKKNWFYLCLAVMFSSVLWPMAVYFSYGFALQSQTGGWSAADEATVMESRVVSSSRRKRSTTYRPSIKYNYRVGTLWHVSERITFSSGFSDSGGGYAQSLTAQHPAGAKVTVYVDPADWTSSVLLKGLHDRDWQSLAFIGPFAVAPLVVWGLFIGGAIRSGRGHVGNVRVFEPGPGVSVFRDIAFGPWSAGLCTLLGGVIATTVLILGFIDTHTRDTLFACWGGTMLAAVAAFAARWYWIKSGREDAVIDLDAGTLSLPRGFKGTPETIELARIVDTELIQDSNSSTNKRPHWRVHLRIDGAEATRPVADIHLKSNAGAFESWLRARLALPDGASRTRAGLTDGDIADGD